MFVWGFFSFVIFCYSFFFKNTINRFNFHFFYLFSFGGFRFIKNILNILVRFNVQFFP